MTFSEQILYSVYSNSAFAKQDFDLTNTSTEFDIYKHKSIDGLELARIKTTSIPHYHTQQTLFCFINHGFLLLGGIDENGCGQVSKISAMPGKIYLIPPYVLHAVESTGSYCELFIHTPGGDRPRESAYPNDTFMVENYKILPGIIE